MWLALFTLFILDYAAAFAPRHGQVVDLGHFEGGGFLGEAAFVKVLEDKRPSRAYNNVRRQVSSLIKLSLKLQ